ncbi:DUF805 domain-containing protein [Rhodanobacter sp. DHG33]|uniref:DUF805 domain-containing protein n=1 Tax=Rhodanobacter sp. DHG33 TaxID=2775921 RepID=UPI001787456C|nr:DUF805 domain-containing protein [Rhodanobacter sp. DHG33]MBD8898076.1 DUF805 domain-containing protein [Rhodanobacter sp. DHG33]
MNFFDWYLNCIKGHYADFEGRARREEFWMFSLVDLIVTVVAEAIGQAVHVPMLSGVYCLVTLLPCIAVGVRRLHDTGRSGWWMLIQLIPLIGGIWLIVLFATAGDSGGNRYGPDPKAGVI